MISVESIENHIFSYLPKEEGKQKDIIVAMNYSVKAGGKRLRPMLIYETSRIFGENEDIYPYMAAIECIHTYSLVHDDLPAMDNDDYRRGLLTTHKKFGHAAGILAGDGLLNLAYEICANAVISSSKPELASRALKVLAECSGVYGMVGGQSVDVKLTGQEIDEDTLRFIYELKTGALIKAAMVIGAILGGASDEAIKKIENIANNVGWAFQIQDDILDVTSTTEELGKPVLSDEKNNKTTYVSLYGLDKSHARVKELSEDAIKELHDIYSCDGYKNNECLEELLLSLVNRRK